MPKRDDFEKAFAAFLDSRDYDEAENALFAVSRASFEAGWNAAGGEPPKADRIIHLLPKDADNCR